MVELSARSVELYTGVGAEGGCEELLSVLLCLIQFFQGSVLATGKVVGVRASSTLMWHFELEKSSSPLPVLYKYSMLGMMWDTLPGIGDTMITGCNGLAF